MHVPKNLPITEGVIQAVFNDSYRQRFNIPNYTPSTWFECDVLSITNAGFSYEYEIKKSVADFKNDFKKGQYTDGRRSFSKNDERVKKKVAAGSKQYTYLNKHEELNNSTTLCPNYFSFIVTKDIVEKIRPLLPYYAGLMYLVERLPKTSKAKYKYLTFEHIVPPKRLHSDKTLGQVLTHQSLAETFYYRMWNYKTKKECTNV